MSTNNSRDRTCDVARTAGAVIGFENMQGKGTVIRRMFADVEADIYVIVDGDDTYDAAAAPRLVSLLWDKLLSSMIHVIFGDRCRDVLSGYRVLSRRFVKSFSALTQGFDIEAELTIH